ncbi:MAG: DUF420 domain-containing protein [Bacteroidetes bacterium]|nr:DUF420 domain-containing protein [Bacteroidota bacterium]
MKTEKIIFNLIVIVSILVPVLVASLFMGLIPGFIQLPERSKVLARLPVLNAALNASTAILLSAGFYFITKKQVLRHKLCMISAFILSCLFLISYIVYHYSIGHTPFGGSGIIRYIYYFILISHIILSVIIIPLSLTTLYRALSGRIAKHKIIARWTLPLWLYVAITGILIYLLMLPYYQF